MRITVVLSATLLSILACPALDASAQGSKGDEELIANAISAAPEAVAQDAAVVAVDAQGQMRTLREGTNNFTCVPDDFANPEHDPVCVDENGLEWLKGLIAKKDRRRAR
jgi:hypothetical protein